MKFDDIVNGAIFVVLGIGIVLHAQTLPKMAHIDYGPGLMPTLVGGGMALAGLALIVGRVMAGGNTIAGLVHFTGQGRKSLIGFGLIIAVILIYTLLADLLGFLLISPVLLFVVVMWFERRWKLALGVAVFGTLALHSFFYQIMKAPLPWGVLQPYSGVLSW